MFRLSFLVLFTFALVHLNAQTTVNGSFVHNGINRTYSFYVPASYIPGQSIPMVIGLHGTSSSGTEFANSRDFRPIADTANFIMVHPDGSTMLGIRFWNFGNVFGSTVDDVGFIEALIDTISANYSINQERIYSVGMSNGGFMTYYLACETNRFAAIGSVTGSMSNAMYDNCNPQRPTPAIHVHGTSDPINPYTGNSSSKSIYDVVMFWVNQNGCDTVPTIFPVTDVNSTDGATAERYLYSNGTNGNTVEHFKVLGGEHTWPGAPIQGSTDITCMDFSAQIEIWRFFNQYTLNSPATVSPHSAGESLSLFPNPTQGKVSIQTGNNTVSEIAIMDMQGNVLEKRTFENIQQVDFSHLKAGNYLVKISGDHFSAVKRLIISSEN